MIGVAGRVAMVVLCMLLVVASGSGASAEVASPVSRIEIVEPRSFGYVIGDTLTRRVVLETDGGATLDADRLPKPGRVSNWIELVDVTARRSGAGGGARHELNLTYQIFNSAPEVSTRALPALRIPLKTAAGTAFHDVPQFLFTSGSLTPEYVAAREGLEEMRPDAPPPPLSTASVRARLALYGLALAAIALYFAYSYLSLPFLARSRGPFARALRAVNAAARARDGRDGRQAALKALHRAFNETARGTVFGEHLDRFFAEHARYAPLRPQVERFFAGSQQEFFGSGAAELSLAWLTAFTRDLRDRERGIA
jgi:mxaA protein